MDRERIKLVKLNLLFVMSLLLASCDYVTDDWQKAISDNTAEAYRAFADKHPQTEYTKQALAKAEALAWKRATGEQSVQAYKTFLKFNPKNTHKNEMYLDFSTDWFLPAEDTEKFKNAKYKFHPMTIRGKGPEKTIKNSKGNFVFMPVKGYVVSGEVTTSLGAVSKKAKLGSWQYIYTDNSKQKIVDYGTCVNSGEIILPVDSFRSALPGDGYINNKFTARLIDNKYVLLSFLDDQEDALCFVLLMGGLTVANSINYNGTVVLTSKGKFTRINDKWVFSP